MFSNRRQHLDATRYTPYSWRMVKRLERSSHAPPTTDPGSDLGHDVLMAMMMAIALSLLAMAAWLASAH
jgi:hypothetical protein